jgi:hypothetical protein
MTSATLRISIQRPQSLHFMKRCRSSGSPLSGSFTIYLLRHTCCDIPVATHEARTAIARLGSKERISSETVLNYSSLLTFAEWSALAVCDSNEPAAVG